MKNWIINPPNKSKLKDLVIHKPNFSSYSSELGLRKIFFDTDKTDMVNSKISGKSPVAIEQQPY